MPYTSTAEMMSVQSQKSSELGFATRTSPDLPPPLPRSHPAPLHATSARSRSRTLTLSLTLAFTLGLQSVMSPSTTAYLSQRPLAIAISRISHHASASIFRPDYTMLSPHTRRTQPADQPNNGRPWITWLRNLDSTRDGRLTRRAATPGTEIYTSIPLIGIAAPSVQP